MLDELLALVGGGGVLALTGAGMSTDSGIPDYRGPSGASRTGRPMTYREFVGDPAARRRYWARSHAGWQLVNQAEPNAAHEALASLEQGGLVTGVITQNVDGLHTAGGSRAVLELHGALARTVCLACDDRRSRLELAHRLEAANPGALRRAAVFTADGDAEIGSAHEDAFVVVDCLECGGVLKPDVVFFGENVPRHRVAQAFAWLDGARALLVLGSSLTVMSGYRFVLAARRAGIPVAIVNLGPTRGDTDCRIRVEAALSDCLGMVASAVLARAGR